MGLIGGARFAKRSTTMRFYRLIPTTCMAMPPWLRRSMVAGSSIVFKIFHLGSIIKVLKLKKKKKKKKKK
jgi:hypothetical protein